MHSTTLPHALYERSESCCCIQLQAAMLVSVRITAPNDRWILLFELIATLEVIILHLKLKGFRVPVPKSQATE